MYDRTTRRHAPIHVSIHVRALELLWVEPPDDNRTLSHPRAPAGDGAAPTGGGRHLVWAEGAEKEGCVLPHTLLLHSDLISIESDPEPPQAAPGAPPAAPPGDHGFTFGGRRVRASLPPLIDPAAWLAGSDEAEASVAADGWCLQPVDGCVRVAGRIDLNAGAHLPHLLIDIVMADGERRLRLRDPRRRPTPNPTPTPTPSPNPEQVSAAGCGFDCVRSRRPCSPRLHLRTRATPLSPPRTAPLTPPLTARLTPPPTARLTALLPAPPQVVALTAVIYWLVRCLQPLLIGLGTQGQWPPRGGSKSGWLEVSEEGTSDARRWGACFVTLGSGVLCFAPSDCNVRLMALRECTLLDPDGRAEPYAVRLRRERGARPAEPGALSAIDTDGAELVLRSDTPSGAAQWRSALRAMMARRAAGPPMARPRADSAREAEQLLMRLVVRPIDAVLSLHASAEQRLVPAGRRRAGQRRLTLNP